MADRGYKDFLEIKEGRKINYKEFIDLYNYCFVQTQDPNIALHVGELYSPEHWSILGYLILNCINFRDFFLSMSRYCIILSNYIHITLNEGEEESEIVFYVNSKAEVKDENCIITAMVNMYRMIGISLQDKVHLNKVELAVDFSDTEEFFRVFGAYPQSSGKFSLTLDNSFLTSPIPCSDSGIQSIFEEHARDIVNLMGTTF